VGAHDRFMNVDSGRRAWVPVGICALLLVACGTHDGTPPGSGPAGSSPASSGPVRLVAVGDIACPPDEEATPVTCQEDATADLTSSLDPDQVVALGDLQYESGAEDDFRAAFEQSWGRFDDILHSVPGNHEYGTEDAAGYDAFVGQEDPTDPDYSAWDAGAWRIYMLDTNCDAIDCVAEQDWFSSDLAAHPTTCAMMAMHHPRFAPLDPEGEATEHGITSFVVGTGGRSLYHQGSLVEGSRFFQATEFGVLELTLRAGEAAWRYLTVDREVLDQGTVSCA
jgi:acid phosphatase type 7